MGSIALDSVTTPAGKVEREPGGSALYAGLSASFYTGVKIVATVGTDFPDEVLSRLRTRSIDTDGISVEEGETFQWCGIYEEDINKRTTVFTRLGVFEHFDPKLPDSYRTERHVFLANIDPVIQAGVLAQMSSQTFTLCDTMNYWIRGKRESLLDVLGKVDALLINDEEALEFSGKTSLLHAGRWLLDQGVGYVVIKKGEHGAVLLGPSDIFALPSFPVYQVVDPTGAGDTFAGAMAGYLSLVEQPGFSELRRAVVRGTVLASFCIEGFGARRLFDVNEEEIGSRTRRFLDMIRID
jgi:sugar/nucleoside kinase (ribokinase family)